MSETEMKTDMVHSQGLVPTEQAAEVACHTPRPWKACGTIYEHMNCEVRSGAKGEGQGIAQVWDGPNAFKDGQLMAAAPDLLEALQEMTPRGLNSDNANIPDDLIVPVDMTMGEIRRARAAIARATGAA